MPDFNNFRKDVDKRLHNVVMTDRMKADVRQKAAEQGSKRTPRRYYGWGFAAAAACLALIIFASGILPSLKENTPSKMTLPEVTAPAVTTAAASSVQTAAASTASQTTAQPAEAVRLSVQATADSSSGIAGDSSFTISGVEDPEVLQFFHITPEVAYTVAKSADGYTIQPSEALKSGTVYTITYTPESEPAKSWAFQTAADFAVVSTLPAGRDDDAIDPRSGIEVNFTLLLDESVDFASYFTIEPAVTGRFEASSHTLRFIPDGPLDADTLYTVTVSEGLPSASGAALSEDHVFRFRTYFDSEETLFYLTDAFTESYLPGDTAALSLYVGSAYDDVDFHARIYRLDSAEDYIALAREHETGVYPIIGRSRDVILDIPETEPVCDATLRLVRNNPDYQSMAAFILPDALEEGWYFVDIVPADGSDDSRLHVQKLIQISPLAVYAESLNGNAVVWVNSGVSGEAEIGAQVSLNECDSQTDIDGVAAFEIGTADGTAVLDIRTDSARFVDLVSVSGETDAENPYYSYLYTDRSAYQPTDEISFWGRLLPRRTGTPLPDTLDLYLDVAYTTKSQAPAMTVEVASDGTFSGVCPVENLISCTYDLRFLSGGCEVLTGYISVMAYEKPVYVLNAEFDRDYYRAGEEARVKLSGTYFDGTPASGLEVTVWHSSDVNGRSTDEGLYLDENGELEYSFTPAVSDGSWAPSSLYCTVETSGAESVWVSASDNAYLFCSNRMLTVESLSDDSAAFEICANLIDFDAVDSGNYFSDYYYDDSDIDSIRGKALMLNGTMSITRCEYERFENGSHFDYINNVTVPDYDYRYCETTVYTGGFRVTNGVCRTEPVELSFDNNCWYECEFITDGGTVQLHETAYIHRAFYPWHDTCYSLYQEIEDGFGIGDTVPYTLCDNNGSVTDGRKLVSIWQDSFIGCGVSDGGAFDLEFTEDLLPNVVLSGAYFDGRHIFSVYPYHLYYSNRERELNVTVTPSDNSCAPGTAVSADISVTLPDGTPVSAPFAFGVVDNAAFAVENQITDPWLELYGSTYYDSPVSYVSYILHQNMGAVGEGGGEGGGGQVRDDFKDTAAFLTGHTDANGHASVSFDLPDNLTSWRLTAVSVADTDGRYYGGKGVSEVSATLPGFLNVVYNEEILTGDDLSVSVRTVGAKNELDCTATLSGNGLELNRNIHCTPDGFTFVNFGAQKPGEYKLTVIGTSGEFSDAVSYIIRVVESRQEIRTSTVFSLSDGVSVDSLRWPVTLTFCRSEDALILRALNRASVSGNTRLDGVLTEALRTEFLTGSSVPVSGFQGYDGGICLFTYGSASADTTAWALITAPERFRIDDAREYLYSLLYNYDSPASEIASAYMGLAALHEPVLGEIRMLLSSESFELRDRWKLASALALLGDHDGALDWYDTVGSREDLSGNSDESFESLLYAAFLNDLCGTPASESLLEQVLSIENSRISPAFPLLSYIRQHSNSDDNSASFSYQLGGTTQTQELEQGRFFPLTLSESELAAADFRVLSGNISVSASCVAPLSDIRSDSDISVEVVYSGDALSAGGEMPVSIDVTLPEKSDYTEVSLILPTGLRLCSVPQDYNAGWYFLGEEKNRLRFSLNSTDQTTFHISFTARCILPGTFTAEPCVVTVPSTGDTAYSNSQTVIVANE